MMLIVSPVDTANEKMMLIDKTMLIVLIKAPESKESSSSLLHCPHA